MQLEAWSLKPESSAWSTGIANHLQKSRSTCSLPTFTKNGLYSLVTNTSHGIDKNQRHMHYVVPNFWNQGYWIIYIKTHQPRARFSRTPLVRPFVETGLDQSIPTLIWDCTSPSHDTSANSQAILMPISVTHAGCMHFRDRHWGGPQRLCVALSKLSGQYSVVESWGLEALRLNLSADNNFQT